MKIPKLKFKKITAPLKKLPRIFGEHAFLTFLGLLLFSLILSSLVFYKYSILAEKTEPEVSEKPFKFKEKTYEAVLKTWQEKEKRFKEIDLKEYQSLFGEIKKELPSPVSEETQEISETEFYIISKGETLWELAEKYLGSGKRWREIKTESGQIFTESSAEVIPIGQKLIVPLK
jgi:hypothetical protein